MKIENSQQLLQLLKTYLYAAENKEGLLELESLLDHTGIISGNNIDISHISTDLLRQALPTKPTADIEMPSQTVESNDEVFKIFARTSPVRTSHSSSRIASQ